MSLDKEMKIQNGLDLQSRDVEDSEVEMALRNFRQSVRGWSEVEFARPQTVQPARRGVSWWLVRHMGAAWALAGVLVVAGVSVPVGLHFEHEHSAMEARKAAEAAAEKKEQARIAELQQRAHTLDDEAFLKDVDSDIAQDAPDAMEPLASLMNESSTK